MNDTLNESQLDKVFKRPAVRQLCRGIYLTGHMEAGVEITEIDKGDHTVEILVNEQWFKANDLREAAALFIKMAESLEAQENGL